MPRSRRFVPVPPDPAHPAPAAPGPPDEHSLSHFEVPSETTPTWELEMLVSGAVLFGLIQLPPLVSSAFASITPRLGGKAFIVAFEAYLFGKAILYALIGGFILHLASRAYWVALVGLDSVFPRGIRWEKGTFGPLTREVFRSRFVSLPVRVERIDNFSSVIFAAAFGIVFLLLTGVLLLAAVAGAALLITHLFLRDQGFQRVFLPLFFLFFLLPLVAFAIDRRVGARLPADGAAARFIRAVAVYAYRVQGIFVHGPITQTLFTNVRKRIVLPAMILTMMAAIGGAVLDLLAVRNRLSLGGYDLLPASGAGVLSYRYYADQRAGDDRYSTVASIQSDVIRDPYIRLFVPYVPVRDDDALHRSCPAAATLAGAAPGAARERTGLEVLACLGRMRAVSVDGRAIDPDFRFYTDPQSGMKGLLGYIPVDGLAKGRHVLVLQPTTAPAAEKPRPRPDSIPFRI